MNGFQSEGSDIRNKTIPILFLFLISLSRIILLLIKGTSFVMAEVIPYTTLKWKQDKITLVVFSWDWATKCEHMI